MTNYSADYQKEQAITFLQALSYKPTDKIWVRLLPGKGYDATTDKLHAIDGYLTLNNDLTDFTWTRTVRNKVSNQWEDHPTYFDGYRWLKQQNDKGYGVYITINKGGRTDAHIKTCGSQFVDFDDGTKEKQLERINEFALRPSMIIETRRGYHAYWLLDDPETPIERFRELQQRLNKVLGSDPSVMNESRLMRFPGFNHMVKNEEPLLTIIKTVNGSKYTQEKLDEVLPELAVYQKTVKTKDRSKSEKKDTVTTVPIYSIYKGGSCDNQAVLQTGFNHELAVQFKTCGCDYEELTYKDVRYLLLWVPGVTFNPDALVLKGNIPSENPNGSKTVGYFWLLPDKENGISFKDSVKDTKEYYRHLYARAVNNGMPENNKHRKHWGEYLKGKAISNDNYYFLKGDVLEVNSKYFDFEQTKKFILETTNNLKDKVRLLVKSGLGTGKTTVINGVADWLKKSGQIKKRIFFCPLNSISKQQAKKYGYIHLQDKNIKLKDKHEIANDDYTDVCCCLDSIDYFTEETLTRSDVLIIIDEIHSILTKFTTEGKREHHLKKLRVISEDSNFVMMDGMLNDRDVNLIGELSSGFLSLIKNTYSEPVDLELIAKHCEHKTKVIRKLSEGKKLYVPSDNKGYLTALEPILTNLGYKCLLVTRETRYELEVDAFLQDPDETIKDFNYNVILASPTVCSGLSIDIKDYFDEVIGHFTGVLTTDSIFQMLKRVRDPNVKVSCFVANSNPSHPLMRHYLDDAAKWLIKDYTNVINNERIIDKNYIINWLNTNYDEHGINYLYQLLELSQETLENQAIKLVEHIATQKATSPTSKYANDLKTVDDFEKYNYRECFLKCLEINGYTYKGESESEDPTAIKENNKVFKETKKELTEHEIEQTMTHDTLPTSELINYENKVLTPEERYKVSNAEVRKYFGFSPGTPLLENPVFWAKALKDSDFKQNCLTTFYYENIEYTKQQKIEQILPKDKPMYAMETNLHKVYTAKDKALVLKGCKALTTLINLESFTNEHPALNEVIEYFQIKDNYFPLGYNKQPKIKGKIQWFGYLLKRIGLKTEGIGQESKGKKNRVYKIVSLDDLTRQTVDAIKKERNKTTPNAHVNSVPFTKEEKTLLLSEVLKGYDTILYHDIECEIITFGDKSAHVSTSNAVIVKALQTSNKIDLIKGQYEFIYSLDNCQRVITEETEIINYDAIVESILENTPINIVTNLTPKAIELFDIDVYSKESNYDAIYDVYFDRCF